MFVAASTDCFPELSLEDAIGRLIDLEYTAVEIAVSEYGNQIRPSQVLEDLDKAIFLCRDTHRLTPAAYSVEIAPGDDYFRQWAACCKLAKASKVVAICIRAGELGTPFNAEIERLREMVRIASHEGVVVGLKTETGHVTQDPATAMSLCDNVKGLGITLDPSHFIFGPHKGSYDQLFKNVVHVHLRDTSKDKLQVRVGQGEVEYGRLVTQLAAVNYNRALSVNMISIPDVEQRAEMRKMRLLLESLL